MLAILAALFTSASGGAIFRVVLDLVSKWMSDSREEKAFRREHERDLAMANSEKLQELRLAEIKHETGKPSVLTNQSKIKIGSFVYEYRNQKQRPPVLHRVRIAGGLMWLFALTYCLAVLELISAGTSPVATLSPQELGARTSLFFGLFSSESSEAGVAYLTSSGLAVYMLMPLVFIFTFWITGIARDPSNPKRA